jgi:hypothetical protein
MSDVHQLLLSWFSSLVRCPLPPGQGVTILWFVSDNLLVAQEFKRGDDDDALSLTSQKTLGESVGQFAERLSAWPLLLRLIVFLEHSVQLIQDHCLDCPR